MTLTLGPAFWRGVLGEDSPELARLAADPAYPQWGPWCIAQGLGPMIYHAFRQRYPSLAAPFQHDYLTALAEYDLYRHTLDRLTAGFATIQLPLVLLKGGALALTVYPRPELRTMSDLDVWVAPGRLEEAVQHIQAVGFRHYDKYLRPTPPRLTPSGKVKFNLPDWATGGVELHRHPMPGWWLEHAATVDDVGLWQRRQPLTGLAGPLWRLSAEDSVLQVALHLAVSNQMQLALWRGLLDVAWAARAPGFDWTVAAQRARAWGVGTAVWLVCDRLEAVGGAPGVEMLLAMCRPAPARQKWLQRLAPATPDPARRLLGRWQRRALLALLIDRPGLLLHHLVVGRRRA